MVNFLFSHLHLFGHYQISFISVSFFFISLPHIFICIFTVHAGYPYVTDTVSTPTITYCKYVNLQIKGVEVVFVIKHIINMYVIVALHCRATLICASFGGLIIYYHFPFFFHFFLDKVRTSDHSNE